MRKSIIGCLLFIMAFASCSDAKKEANYNEALKRVLSAYESVKTEDKALLIAEYYNSPAFSRTEENYKAAFDKLEFFVKEYPLNDKFLVLTGNLYTKFGGYYAKKMNFANAMKYCGLGFDMIDSALERHPDDVYFLMYRGINSVSVPGTFNRLPIGLKDLSKLYGMIDTPDMSERQKVMTLFYYAKGLKKDNQKDLSDKIIGEMNKKFPDNKKYFN